MKLGILFTGTHSLRDTVQIGMAAERAGFDSLYMVEAYRSAWVALTALAAATTRVNLGPYVINAYARSPLLAGMTAVDFNEYSNGRLILGVGGGNKIINEVWQGIAHARVLTKMREYVGVLRAIAHAPAHRELVFNGAIHRMRWTPRVASQPFSVHLAAVFPAMMKVAAQVADGIAGGATLSPEYLRANLRPMVTRLASDAGRNPRELAWRAVMFTAVAADREQARRAARQAICALYAPLPHPYYEYTMREQGFANVVNTLCRLMPAGETEAAIDAIPDQVVDTLCIAGTPEECRARIRAYDGLLDELLLSNCLPVESAGWEPAYRELLALAG